MSEHLLTIHGLCGLLVLLSFLCNVAVFVISTWPLKQSGNTCSSLFSGTVLRCDVTGKVVMKCFLSGMPDLKLGLNDKIGLEKEAQAKARPSRRFVHYRTYGSDSDVAFFLLTHNILLFIVKVWCRSEQKTLQSLGLHLQKILKDQHF